GYPASQIIACEGRRDHSHFSSIELATEITISARDKNLLMSVDQFTSILFASSEIACSSNGPLCLAHSINSRLFPAKYFVHAEPISPVEPMIITVDFPMGRSLSRQARSTAFTIKPAVSVLP